MARKYTARNTARRHTDEKERPMSSMEEVWAYREETLYPQLFGDKRSGIYVLDFDVFSSLGTEDIDPAWLHLGVFEFEPTPARNSWLYVTSGGSTPWATEPAEYLFNIPADERERANLAKKEPERLAAMRANWDAWNATMPAIPEDATVSLGYSVKDMPQR
jgi:hypothetical protein